MPKKPTLHLTEDGHELKNCCRCHKWHPLDNFSKATKCWDKLSPSCRNCNSERQKKISLKRKENKKPASVNNMVAEAVLDKIGKSLIQNTIHTDVFGCSIEYLKGWLEAQVISNEPWRTFQNEWNITMIIPISNFDLTDPRQQYRCFNYRNISVVGQQVLPRLITDIDKLKTFLCKLGVCNIPDQNLPIVKASNHCQSKTKDETKKCSKCQKIQAISNFAKRGKDKHQSWCKICTREYKRLWKCVHGIRKSMCKECGGSEICEHQRERRVCKECDGIGRCEHGRVRRICKDCKGSGICKHNNIKATCKKCKGREICTHGKRTYLCADCNGKGICKHKKIKRQCAECNGSSMCSHGKQKHQCTKCRGSSFCDHGKIRNTCRECNGSSMCEHGRRLYSCTEGSCGLIPSTKKCPACCSKTITPKKDDPNSTLCASCRKGYGIHEIKKFEKEIEIWLTEESLPWSYSNKKLPCAPTTRYPDYLFVGLDHVVLLEVDENQHRNYEIKCEVARISEIMDSIDAKNLHVIRYNPNVKKDDDMKKQEIIDAIKLALKTNMGCLNDTGCVIQYINYSEDRIQDLDKLICKK